MIRGACGDISSGRVDGLGHHVEDRQAGVPGLGQRARRAPSAGMPSSLVSSWSAVTNSWVPATLKSMSPKASSAPRMSVSATYSRLAVDLAGDQAHRDAGDRRPQRHTGLQQRQRRGADRAHRGGAVGAHRLGDLTDRVGELLARRQHRQQRPLGERAVADLAALRRADAAGLTGGVRREVVVVHVALAASPARACRASAPCGSMFSVVTPRIWVSPRSNSAEPCTRGMHARPRRTAVRMSVRPRPSMRTLSRSTRSRTSFLVSERNAAPISFSRPSNCAAELLEHGGLDLVERGPRAPACRRSSAPAARSALTRRPRRRRRRRPRSRGRPGTPGPAWRPAWPARPAPRTSCLMNGLAASRPSATTSSVGAWAPACDEVPGLLGGLGLDHHDRDVAGLGDPAGDDHVEDGVLELAVGREGDPLAVDQRDADAADRAGERQAGELGGQRRGVDREHVVGLVGVERHAR